MPKVNLRSKQSTYLLDAATEEAVAGTGKHFDAIHCTTAGTIQIKAAAVFQYLAAVAEGATNSNTTFINPETGVAFVAADDDIPAGFYEGDGSQYVNVPMTAGQTIYARITAAKIPTSGTWRGEALRY